MLKRNKMKKNEHEVEEEEIKSKSSSKRSWVWEHFNFDNTVKKAVCNYCKALIVCNKGSTTGLSNHLKSKHLITKSQGKKQLTIHEVIDNSKEVVSIMFYYL